MPHSNSLIGGGRKDIDPQPVAGCLNVSCFFYAYQIYMYIPGTLVLVFKV